MAALINRHPAPAYFALTIFDGIWAVALVATIAAIAAAHGGRL